mmetsp:Transcript_19780/g.49853  ORF Transcript_19780/g.49853 Transcript_19780/m.49853 type:complete len:129 (-) Transcript_19780:1419-1805(-)
MASDMDLSGWDADSLQLVASDDVSPVGNSSRGSGWSSRATYWHKPVLNSATNEPGYYLKSLTFSSNNAHKEIPKIHEHLKKNKKIIIPSVPSFANARELVLCFSSWQNVERSFSCVFVSCAPRSPTLS